MRNCIRREFDECYEKQPNGCWIWIAGITGSGYGNFKIPNISRRPRKNISAHKYAYVRAYGEVPEGLEVTHSCLNALCVNPDHLVAKTHIENIREKRTSQFPIMFRVSRRVKTAGWN